MKFSCSHSTLVKALNIVSKAVTSRTTIPILKGILIEAKDNGTVRFAASDLDLSIEKIVEAEVYLNPVEWVDLATGFLLIDLRQDDIEMSDFRR